MEKPHAGFKPGPTPSLHLRNGAGSFLAPIQLWILTELLDVCHVTEVNETFLNVKKINKP